MQPAPAGSILDGLQRPSGLNVVRRRDHRGQVFGREELGHELHLLDADAVLAGDAAAEVDALVEDLVARQQDALHLLGVALVEQQDRVDVAVAGVKDVGDAQVVPLADVGDEPQDVRQLGARHDAVLRAVARAEPADRAEGLLAALPEATIRAPCGCAR